MKFRIMVAPELFWSILHVLSISNVNGSDFSVSFVTLFYDSVKVSYNGTDSKNKLKVEINNSPITRIWR